MNSEKLEAIAFAWQGELMPCFLKRTNRFSSSNPVSTKIYQSNLMNYQMKWPEYLNGSFNIQDLNWSLASYHCKWGLDRQENVNGDTAQEPNRKISGTT